MSESILDVKDILKLQSASELISFSEQHYSEQINNAVDLFYNKRGHRLVMLAGPSSSGKTTTAKLMCEETERRGRAAKIISLDDFYLDQTDNFYFEDGTPDYETHEALDVAYIGECLSSLVQKGECELPRFSFYTHKREPQLVHTKLDRDEVVIIEGLHAINPAITDGLNSDSLTRLYVSVSSRISCKNEILLTKRDMRFIRRLIRDYNFRNAEIDFTFYLWQGVLMGEERYIFPFRGLADRKIDSFHAYEPCVFKETVLKLLDCIDENSIYFEKADRLREKLCVFESISPGLIPPNSLLREFIG